MLERLLKEEQESVQEVVGDEDEGGEQAVHADHQQPGRGEVCQRHDDQDQQDVHLGAGKLDGVT